MTDDEEPTFSDPILSAFDKEIASLETRLAKVVVAPPLSFLVAPMALRAQ